MNDNKYDILTGVGNRKSLADRFLKIISYHSQLSLIWSNLDGLRFYNYYYGHQEGDAILKETAALIRLNIPKDAEVFRIGGNDFLVLVANPDLALAIAAARQIREAVETQFSGRTATRLSYVSEEAKLPTSLTISCGIAVYPNHGTDLMMLLEAADMALMAAKQQGGNQVIVQNQLPL